MNDHLHDDAELYALGFTDPERSSAIEAHIAGCAECRARVIAAEEAAASLSAALAVPAATRERPRAPWTSGLAAAAAVVFAATAGIEAVALQGSAQQGARTGVALAAVAASHFGHTTLTSAPGSAVKVLYARDGGWLYVIADGVPAGVHAVVRQSGRERDLGPLGPGKPATLFVADSGRVSDVTLVDGGRAIAHGSPAY